MADVKSLNAASFPAFLADHSKVKVVRFWATWCRPCTMLEPTYEALADELADIADFGEVDIDKASDVSGALGIRSVPTVLVIKGTTAVASIVGSNAKSSYLEAIRKAV
ncbi:thioredoxin domain-containing protein [Novosphingobium sp. 1949]|uniref:Thioredoxin n=1 Tax=Novosphingobium organovorum TaxID=2930092 RepID=A0ABT0BBV3_9SPHN|nr:thioredoxin domain-containing protein [Novosphingobium organovorum]MCJ2182518.1 thioredoxin domain-containing protein [Novosphingobium organovorum]